MKKILVNISVLLLISVTTFAKGGEDSLALAMAKAQKLYDSIESAMKYQSGTIALPAANVTLKVPSGFKYLNAEQANYIITEIWGNPPQEGVLGMLLPGNSSVIDNEPYAFVITFDAIGYVKDDDAGDINYDDMLKQLQKEEVEENKKRTAQGFQAIHFVGWASKPFYDKEHKVLHWAKNLHFEGSEDNTLNYEVRILGRKGVLSLNAVSGMNNLDSVKRDINKVLAMPSFNSGSTYGEFDSKTDEVAAWTIGGLVAGKLLLKAGFFAMAGKFLLATWKFILIGVIAAWAAIKKFFGKKKAEEVEPVSSNPA